MAAELYAYVAKNEAQCRKQCDMWQDQVADLVYGGTIEEDGTFLKLNRSALHHERAKTLLRFDCLQEARRELNTAWKTLQPNLPTWHVNMYLTEAKLFLVEHDVEGSAKSGVKAYELAKTIHSQKSEVEVVHLLETLQQLDSTNTYVCTLNTTVGGNA
jgi:hypothetical protein